MIDRWLTIKQVAELTGKHPQTIRGWISREVLKYGEDWQQVERGKKRSTIYIRELSVPAFLRKQP